MPSKKPSPFPSESDAGSGRIDPWAVAVEHLRGVDPRWLPLIDRIGPCRLRPQADRFGILVRAIVGQQISARAATSINRRLLDLQGSARHRAEALLNLGVEGIRQAGLSGVKSNYVLHLSEAVEAGRVPLSQIGKLTDQEILARLTEIRGVGPWTAEMFLIFALNRPDVLSVGDLGVRVGIRDHYGLAEMPSPRQCVELAEPWRPFRSVAMWYLWRSIDTPPTPPDKV